MIKIDNETALSVAALYAAKSKASRAKVGACLVLPTGVLVPGYNGTPSGWDNTCEIQKGDSVVTKPEVLHAELNCILKCAKEGLSCEGAYLYTTLSPCLHCCAMISSVGIKGVLYSEEYRDTSGLELLNKQGIPCHKME